MSTTPLYLVTGVHGESIAAATLRLQFQLPKAVVVHHELDVRSGALHRTVSDITGVLERETVPLGQACLCCAVREDVVPVLDRLDRVGRWQAIVVHLPVATSAASVSRMLGHEQRAAPGVRTAGIVVALDGATVVADLLGESLLADRNPASAAAGDERGVGEVLAALVEYADAVTVFGDPGDESLELLRLLVRPGVQIGPEAPDLPADRLLRGLHDHLTSERWVQVPGQGPRRDAETRFAWRMELTASVPLHPQRLQWDIDSLVGGRFRARGCFWLPSRPQQVGVWDGAGGQLSIGTLGSWGRARPFTRLLFTGLMEEDVRDRLQEVFAGILLTDAELRSRGAHWDVATDGLEPWLGRTSQVA